MRAGRRQRVTVDGQRSLPWPLSRSVIDSVGLAGAEFAWNADTCSSLRASVRGFQRPEQPAMVTGWPTVCKIHVHSAGVQQSVWDCRKLANSQIGALDRGWRLASQPLFPDRCTG